MSMEFSARFLKVRPCSHTILPQVKKPFIFTAALFPMALILPKISVIKRYWTLFGAFVVNLSKGLNHLSPPHTSRLFVGQREIFTCRLVCGEFRQVCGKFGACRAISDSDRSQNVLSTSVQWTKVICRDSRGPQPIHRSLVYGKLMARKIFGRYDPGKKSAVLRQRNRLICGTL